MSDLKNRFPGLPSELIDALDAEVVEPDGPAGLPSVLAQQYAGTGWLSGGLVSINGQDVDITSGTGRVVNLSNPLAPLVNPSVWSQRTAVTVVNIATDGTTVFCFDDTKPEAVLSQVLRENLTDTDRATKVLVGSVAHAGGVLLAPALTAPLVVGYDGHTTQVDFFTSLGPMIKRGNVFSPNGANLSVDVTSGSGFRVAVAARTNPNMPSTDSQGAFVGGVSGGSLNNGHVLTTVPNVVGTGPVLVQFNAFVTPALMDDGAGGTMALAANDWQIMHHYRGVDTGDPFFALGDTTFNQKTNAVDALNALGGTLVPDYSPLNDLMFTGYLVIRGGATDLTDITHAEFFPPPAKFRL